jgi:hypothetical protein
VIEVELGEQSRAIAQLLVFSQVLAENIVTIVIAVLTAALGRPHVALVTSPRRSILPGEALNIGQEPRLERTVSDDDVYGYSWLTSGIG